MGKIITMGEIMLRLSTPGQSRFVQTDTFDVNYGGGEANVAVSCANYGHEAYFVSKLPKHEIGQAALNALRRFGVHTDYIARFVIHNADSAFIISESIKSHFVYLAVYS